MASAYPARQSVDEIESTIGSLRKMRKVGAGFAAVGYLLVGAALFFELTEFHPLLERWNAPRNASNATARSNSRI